MKNSFFIFIVVLIGIFFRFFNLPWGEPFFFHPDERNIAQSISQIRYPTQLNPHFFAYGSLPIYSIYFTGVLTNGVRSVINQSHLNTMIVGFEDAIIIGRFYSFFLSLLLLILIYIIAKDLGGKIAGYVSLAFGALSVGFIQYSHFATFEIWLSYFTLLLAYLLIRYTQTKKNLYILLASIVVGFLISIKVSSVVYLPLCLLVILTSNISVFKKETKRKIIVIERLFLKIVFFIGLSIISTYFTSPYYWLDNASFLSSIHYESSVALGSLPVFYTQEFVKTVPFIYQIFHVYPFILNPFNLFLLPVILYISFKSAIKKRNITLLILYSFFIIALISQVFLFVKWVRYYIPTLPFLYIFMGIQIAAIQKVQNIKKYFSIIFYTLIIVSLLYSFSYFKTVLLDPDTRVKAAVWASKNIEPHADIMTEVFDIGITPFNSSFDSIQLFNFYELDDTPKKRSELLKQLKSTQYIIFPSQRIVQSRLDNHYNFPISGTFYKNLFTGQLGFKKVYETECDLFCYILYFGSPVFAYEQTSNVFDRPTVFIFKKK